MKTKVKERFITVRSEGGLLPLDFLEKIARLDAEIAGLAPESFHLFEREKINEAINRAWDRLLGCWVSFKSARKDCPPDDPLLRETRERWLLPFFDALGYGRLVASKAVDVDGKSFPITHFWQTTPIHLTGVGVDLDRRTSGIAGAARSTPHGLVQEFLNRSDDHLWAFLSNGRKLRILRDNISLTRQAYVEFDLEGIMDGEQFSDFRLLWLLCHQSRVEADSPEDCWLEKWSKAALASGIRVREDLRKGVHEAIILLGTGFLQHPANNILQSKLKSGDLSGQDYYRQLLRVIYRLLFLFVAEDRNLLMLREAPIAARNTYIHYYSTLRVRDLAGKRKGSQHLDLWQAQRLIFAMLGNDNGCPELALPGLGSLLWDKQAVPDLNNCAITNRVFLDAIRALAYTEEGKARRAVDFKNLRSEELGSIYEALLEMHPEVNPSGQFRLATEPGNERKTTGSYYTQEGLVSCLLDDCLEPVVNQVARSTTAKDDILNIKVCDPACGSGHFLIAAAHRIARRLAAIRSEESEPAPESYRAALRDVIAHCIYGVDVNEMAVELCKISLWLESLEPGKPLSFLDNHVKCGNSLLGVTPKRLNEGIPDEAFDAMPGDNKSMASALKRRNAEERDAGQLRIGLDIFGTKQALANSIKKLESHSEESVAQVREKEEIFREISEDPVIRHAKLMCNTWCAAFVNRKTAGANHPITQAVLEQMRRGLGQVSTEIVNSVGSATSSLGFFHWHLEFPEIFNRLDETREKNGVDELDGMAGWAGGFDVVIGNPPWVRQEMLKDVKNILKTYKSFRSAADLSVFFVDRALQITRIGGRIGLLTPNKWFRANYGEGLRALCRKWSRLCLIVDFGHSRTLFPDADTFPAAIVCERIEAPAKDDIVFRFVKAHDCDRETKDLSTLISESFIDVPHTNLRDERWELEDEAVAGLLDRLLHSGVSLLDYVGQAPVYGIKSGFNEAFYLDDDQQKNLVREHSRSTELLRKMLRGRDLGRWKCNWNQQWHIVIPSSQNHPWPWSALSDEDAAEEVFAKEYPAIHRHLKQHENKLRARADQGRFWWELRACDYYPEFSKHKITVQCIASHSQFALDSEGFFLNNKVILIPSEDLYLLAILNSRICWWIIARIFQLMKDGGFSMDVQYLVKLPIPKCGDALREEICQEVQHILSSDDTSSLSSLQRECKLGALIESAFGLTLEERDTLLASLPPRDPIERQQAGVESLAVSV